MRIRSLLVATITNFSSGSLIPVESNHSQNSVNIKRQLKLSVGALNREVFWQRVEAQQISAFASGTL